MNRYRCSDQAATTASRQASFWPWRDLQNNADTTALSRRSARHLRSVNYNGKGSRSRRPAKHQRVAGATKADTRSNSLHEWLAQEAATENRHGPKSRAQAARTDHHRFLRGHQHRSAREIIDR